MKQPDELETRHDVPAGSARPEGETVEPELVASLSAAIRAVAEDTAESEVLIGALLEGAVYVAHRRLPPERHDEVAWAMRRLLADRLDAYGFPGCGEVRTGCAVD
jgi:hypothetical protein